MSEWTEFYHRTYDPENEAAQGTPHGWIQWKGTSVCIDLRCPCGHGGHLDGEFLYYVRCPECKTAYAVGQVVKLLPLTESDVRNQRLEEEERIKTWE